RVLLDERKKQLAPVPETARPAERVARAVVRLPLRWVKPRLVLIGLPVIGAAGWETPIRIGEHVAGQGGLLLVVDALNAQCRAPYFLDGRQQQAYQNGNDRNNHQQFDQRETGARRRIFS